MAITFLMVRNFISVHLRSTRKDLRRSAVESQRRVSQFAEFVGSLHANKLKRKNPNPLSLEPGPISVRISKENFEKYMEYLKRFNFEQ